MSFKYDKQTRYWRKVFYTSINFSENSWIIILWFSILRSPTGSLLIDNNVGGGIIKLRQIFNYNCWEFLIGNFHPTKIAEDWYCSCNIDPTQHKYCVAWSHLNIAFSIRLLKKVFIKCVLFHIPQLLGKQEMFSINRTEGHSKHSARIFNQVSTKNENRDSQQRRKLKLFLYIIKQKAASIILCKHICS